MSLSDIFLHHLNGISKNSCHGKNLQLLSDVKVRLRLDFIMEANIMDPNQTGLIWIHIHVVCNICYLRK